MDKSYELATLGVRAGQARSEFNEHSEALFLTSSFVFESARQAAGRFSGGEDGFVYSRFTNPTVTIGGVTVAVNDGFFSGLAPTFIGLYQVNVQVPATAPTGDAIPVIVELRRLRYLCSAWPRFPAPPEFPNFPS